MKGRFLKINYSNPKFSKKMLKKIHPLLSDYIIALQENKIGFNPEEFIQIEESAKNQEESMKFLKKPKANDFNMNSMIVNQGMNDSCSFLDTTQNKNDFMEENYNIQDLSMDSMPQSQFTNTNFNSQVFQDSALQSNKDYVTSPENYLDYNQGQYYTPQAQENAYGGSNTDNSFSYMDNYSHQNQMNSQYSQNSLPHSDNNYACANQVGFNNNMYAGNNGFNNMYGNVNYSYNYGSQDQQSMQNLNAGSNVNCGGMNQEYYAPQGYLNNNSNPTATPEFYCRNTDAQELYQQQDNSFYNNTGLNNSFYNNLAQENCQFEQNCPVNNNKFSTPELNGGYYEQYQRGFQQEYNQN